MVDSGDIGGLVGALIGGYSTLKLLGKPALYTTLGPAYVIGGTLLGLIAGHYLGHKIAGSNHSAAHH